jgi:hypothetical protein
LILAALLTYSRIQLTKKTVLLNLINPGHLGNILYFDEPLEHLLIIPEPDSRLALALQLPLEHVPDHQLAELRSREQQDLLGRLPENTVQEVVVVLAVTEDVLLRE